jgi:integrase
VNAKLALARTMNDREDIWNDIGAGIRTWTYDPKKGISADGKEDTDNAIRFLKEFPELVQAMASDTEDEPSPEALRRMMEEHIFKAIASLGSQRGGLPGQSAGPPANPMRMSIALEQYQATKTGDHHTERTAIDANRLLRKFVASTVEANPALGSDPFVHDFSAHHLSGFLDQSRKKSSKDDRETDAQAAPRTLLKKMGTLRAFFDWARDEREATALNPAAAFAKREQGLRKAASHSEEHYDPFRTEHLRKMFRPHDYLAFNNQADHFWAPLLGLHLGARLSEIVTLELSSIGQHAETGIWYLDVTPERAKNKNSIRRLPISERLVQLGFIDYVEHVRRLNATLLFPHCDFTRKSNRLNPSKNCTRRFGAYLDSIGLKDPKLVFHSFRHTVVSALHDGRTPPTDAMQIAGHVAQDFFVRIGALSASETAGTHLKTYVHSDKARPNVEYPLARLKEHLDRCIDMPLDYKGLRVAASVVQQHTFRTSEGFRSGWHTNSRKYADQQLERL